MKIPPSLERQRSKWQFRGDQRPDFATVPEPEQESVWDYPRPPKVEQSPRLVEVSFEGQVIASSRRALRVLETAAPPVYYLPQQEIRMELFQKDAGHSWCEWKGRAEYWLLKLEGNNIHKVAWSYPDPFPEYESLTDYVAFYPAKVDCKIDGVAVEPQPGGFYGGWVTPEIVGPYKGKPGTEWW